MKTRGIHFTGAHQQIEGGSRASLFCRFLLTSLSLGVFPMGPRLEVASTALGLFYKHLTGCFDSLSAQRPDNSKFFFFLLELR